MNSRAQSPHSEFFEILGSFFFILPIALGGINLRQWFDQQNTRLFSPGFLRISAFIFLSFFISQILLFNYILFNRYACSKPVRLHECKNCLSGKQWHLENCGVNCVGSEQRHLVNCMGSEQ